MFKKYFLRYKNDIIGYFVEGGESLEYVPSVSEANKIEGNLGYPLGLYPPRLDKFGFVPDKDYTPTEADIRNWLGERVFPENRQGADTLLKSLGLKEYDVWEISKKTKGATLQDYYWFSADSRDVFYDEHPKRENKPKLRLKHKLLKSKDNLGKLKFFG